MKRAIYWLLRKELTLGAFIYKWFGENNIADKMNAKITDLDEQYKQGKNPTFSFPYVIVSMITAITLIFLFRKKIFSFIKKLFRKLKKR